MEDDEHNKRKKGKVLTEEEMAVEIANLKAWNRWGRVWRLERTHCHSNPYVVTIMKTRTLTYRRTYLKIILSLGGLSDKSIVDVGCGTSEYLKWLATDCSRLVGVDISIEMLKLCREDIGKSVDLVAADALHLPFREDVFDVGMTFQALHHFPDWQKALTEMVRITKQVSLYEPNGDSAPHRLMHLIRRTFRVEQRFKQINEEYELVEFKASGFSPSSMIDFLTRKNVNARVFMFDMIPVSLLSKIAAISPFLLQLILVTEDLIRKIPILRNQLGSVLVIGFKNKLLGKNKWR